MVWGGDLLPKKLGPRKVIQKEFVEGEYIDNYFKRLKENCITCVLIPGNDDLDRFDAKINDLCSKYNNIINVDKTKVTIGDVDFIGLSNVLDNPFKSKNRVLMEDGLEMEEQLSQEIWIEHDTRVITPEEWRKYRETDVEKMKDVLDRLPKMENNKKTVFVFHDPPYGIGLDNCSVGIKAGSKDMAKYITESGAYMSLHGHIHESPDVSGVWRAKLGNTVCIQPGQSELGEKSFTYVIIDTDKDTQERFIKM